MWECCKSYSHCARVVYIFTWRVRSAAWTRYLDTNCLCTRCTLCCASCSDLICDWTCLCKWSLSLLQTCRALLATWIDFVNSLYCYCNSAIYFFNSIMWEEWPSPSFTAASIAACRSCAKWFILVKLYRIFLTLSSAYSFCVLIARTYSCLRAMAMFNWASWALFDTCAYCNLATRFLPAAMLRWRESNANYWFYFYFFTLSYIRVMVCKAASR